MEAISKSGFGKGNAVVKFARFGYASKGVVYVVAGVLSALAAFSATGQSAGTKESLQVIENQTFGGVLLMIIAAGLFAYSLWKVVQATIDPEQLGEEDFGILRRAASLVSGLIYGFVGVYAVKLSTGMFGGGSGGGGNGAQSWSAEAMSWPGGRWLVAIAGVVIGVYALIQFYQGYKLKFVDKLMVSRMSDRELQIARFVGRAGLWGRGVVFLFIGGFLVQAAVQFDPQEAEGLSGTLEALLAQPYGEWLMGVTALGLACYGGLLLFKAKYRRFEHASDAELRRAAQFRPT